MASPFQFPCGSERLGQAAHPLGIDLLRRGLSLAVAILILTSCAFAQDDSDGSWNRFRGPNGSGLLRNCQVTIPWQDSQVSKVPLPGGGNGSPSLAGNRAFLLAADAKTATRYLLAVDMDSSRIAWQKSFASTPHALHQQSSYASSTPYVDEERVYFVWGSPDQVDVHAFSHSGEEVWNRKFERYVSQHGFGTSPIVVDGKLILLNSQDAQELPPGVAPGKDMLIALDCKTGKDAWHRELPATRVCYGVPCVYRDGSTTQLLCSTTGQGMFGIEAATGKLLWSHPCFEQRICSSSVLVGDILLGTHGSGGGRDNRLVAWDLKQGKELFRIQRSAPYVPTPVAKDNRVFLWSDAGIVSCVSLPDGKVLWTKRIGGDYSGSPVIVGDKLINVSHVGTVHILRASDPFEDLGTLETELTVRSTLAADRSHLLLRTDRELWIIR